MRRIRICFPAFNIAFAKNGVPLAAAVQSGWTKIRVNRPI
jgi:hypothetical protein